MTHATVVILTLVVYKFVLLGIGLIAERRTKGEADFHLGGRGLGPLVAAISAAASSSSAWTLLGVSGYAYQNGLSSLWLLPACIGGFALNWFLLARRLRLQAADAGALTVTELLAGPRRGDAFAAARIFASVVLLIAMTAYVAQQFNAAGKTFATQLEMSEVWSILLGAAIIVTYTMLGGFWAVSLTDTLQGLLMAASAIALPIAALVAVGGPGALVDGLAAVESDGFTSILPAGDGLAPFAVVIVLLSIGVGYPGQPHVVNRFMALRESDAIRTARRYALSWAFIVYPGMIVLGLCGRILMDGVDDQETMFFALTNDLFPSVLGAIITAAVLSAVMSTADSQLLVAASSVSHDLGWKGTDDKGAVLRSRLVVFLLCVAATTTAIFGSKEIFDSVLIAWTLIGATFGPLLVVSLWKHPVGPRRTLVAMVIGFAATALGYMIPATRGGIVERTVPYLLSFAVLLAPGTRAHQSP